MNKQSFLAQLRRGLSGLPRDEIEERLRFYSEMIDDRMEEGLSEEDALREIGDVDALLEQILSDVPLAKLVREKVASRRQPGAWEVLLLALGSPIWLSLLIAALAVLLSLYAVLWSLIAALWAVLASLACGALGGVAACAALALGGSGLSGLAVLGAGLVCAGLAILLFFGCRAASRGARFLTGRSVLGVKKCLVRREGAA